MNETDRDPRAAELRARNRRTGLILATVALVFFIGIFLNHAFIR